MAEARAWPIFTNVPVIYVSPTVTSPRRVKVPLMAPVAAATMNGATISAEGITAARSEEHTSELQSRFDLVCRLLLEKKDGTFGSLTGSELGEEFMGV